MSDVEHDSLHTEDVHQSGYRAGTHLCILCSTTLVGSSHTASYSFTGTFNRGHDVEHKSCWTLALTDLFHRHTHFQW